MYDDPYRPWPGEHDGYGWAGDRDPGLDRLTHLVLVDGRLVETWSEPVTGTRWQRYADRFDRERLPVEPSPPPPPRWQRALDWLADVCGGAAVVVALDRTRLADEGWEPPAGLEPGAQSRLEAAHDLLAAVAERWFDPETMVAFRRALLRLWHDDPDTVLHAPTAAHLAGGICWAVGKANGCYYPQGALRMARVKEALGLKPAISVYGTVVQRALVGFRTCGTEPYWRPDGAPALLSLGLPELLTSATRERLARVRDRALAAQEQEQAA